MVMVVIMMTMMMIIVIMMCLGLCLGQTMTQTCIIVGQHIRRTVPHGGLSSPHSERTSCVGPQFWCVLQDTLQDANAPGKRTNTKQNMFARRCHASSRRSTRRGVPRERIIPHLILRTCEPFWAPHVARSPCRSNADYSCTMSPPHAEHFGTEMLVLVNLAEVVVPASTNRPKLGPGPT